jgi:Ser-tRNA(Ala) deacylase AlaX
MSLKQFWQDPYQTELDTTITSVEDDRLTLAETIFYAFAGGQESDSGTIGGLPVLEARKEGNEIFYTVIGHHFQVGDRVKVAIDWQRRYKLMRLHFAAEIILELVYQNVPSIEKIGAHIAQDKSRIDFVWSENIASLFPTLQAEAKTLIKANHPIISAFSDEANERRYWEIEGFARVSCGGTHLKRTGEIGNLTLKRKNVGKGKERIEIYADESIV